MKFRYPMYIALIILINIAATTLFFRLDLTENKSYSLSKSSKELVANLEEPLTIKVFLSQNLPVPYNNLERDIRDILGEYKLRANKHFNYTIDVINKEGKNNANPETYGIYPVNIQNIESDEVKVVSAYIGMTLIHGDLSEVIPAIEYNQNLEFLISNSLRRITEKTTALLSLEENLRAKLYLSSVLTTVSQDLKDYYKELEKLVTNINKEYFNRITLELIEPNEGELTALGNKYNLNLINIQNGESTQSAIAGIVIEGKNDFIKEELIARDIFGRTVIKGVDDIEGALRSGIDKLVGTGTKVGYLTSNGTIPMNQSSEVSVNALAQIISENYSMQQVDLSQGYISGDINTLIIAKPTVKFSERELFILDQYLLNGNSLLVVLDQFEPDYAMAQYGQENYNKIDHGLLELLAHHGITVESNLVMDEKSFTQTQRDSRGGVVQTQIYFAPMLSKQTLSNHKTLNGINELMTFKASEVKPTYPENTDTISLFTTSENGWRVDFDKVTMDPSRIYPSGDKDKISLGVIKEGEFTSFFKGKTIPEAVYSSPEEGNGATNALENIKELETIINESSKGKLIVLGSSDFVSDQLLNSNFPANVNLIQNMVDYLSNRTDYIDMRSKGVFNRPMIETSPAKRNFIKTLNIAGVPLLVGLLGLLAYFLWLKRKKQIMAIFQGGQNEE